MSADLREQMAILGLRNGRPAAAIACLRSGRVPGQAFLRALADYLEKPPKKTRAKSSVKALQDQNFANVLKELVKAGVAERGRGSRDGVIEEVRKDMGLTRDAFDRAMKRPNRKRRKKTA